MEMREAEKEIRRAIDPRPDQPASSASRDSSITPRATPPPSKEVENTTQGEPPTDKANTSDAVPSGDAVAKDAAESASNPHD